MSTPDVLFCGLDIRVQVVKCNTLPGMSRPHQDVAAEKSMKVCHSHVR